MALTLSTQVFYRSQGGHWDGSICNPNVSHKIQISGDDASAVDRPRLGFACGLVVTVVAVAPDALVWDILSELFRSHCQTNSQNHVQNPPMK